MSCVSRVMQHFRCAMLWIHKAYAIIVIGRCLEFTSPVNRHNEEPFIDKLHVFTRRLNCTGLLKDDWSALFLSLPLSCLSHILYFMISRLQLARGLSPFACWKASLVWPANGIANEYFVIYTECRQLVFVSTHNSWTLHVSYLLWRWRLKIHGWCLQPSRPISFHHLNIIILMIWWPKRSAMQCGVICIIKKKNIEIRGQHTTPEWKWNGKHGKLLPP